MFCRADDDRSPIIGLKSTSSGSNNSNDAFQFENSSADRSLNKKVFQFKTLKHHLCSQISHKVRPAMPTKNLCFLAYSECKYYFWASGIWPLTPRRLSCALSQHELCISCLENIMFSSLSLAGLQKKVGTNYWARNVRPVYEAQSLCKEEAHKPMCPQCNTATVSNCTGGQKPNDWHSRKFAFTNWIFFSNHFRLFQWNDFTMWNSHVYCPGERFSLKLLPTLQSVRGKFGQRLWDIKRHSTGSFRTLNAIILSQKFGY